MAGPAVIVGTAGMLGRALASAAAQRGLDVRAVTGPQELDITDREALTARFADWRPQTVINAAGYTDVDGAEQDPETAGRVNHHGAANLAAACRRHGALLVHVSTDYVFDGAARRPYRPGDPANPINVYGRSKLAGEQAIQEAGGSWLIIRSSWMFAPWGGNFVRTVLERARSGEALSVVDDQRSRPTHAPDLAEIILDLVAAGAAGLYHAANGGECTWFELARAALELAGLDVEVTPCSSDEQARPARRPAYSVLDIAATAAALGPPRSWRDGLAECVEQLAADAVGTSP